MFVSILIVGLIIISHTQYNIMAAVMIPTLSGIFTVQCVRGSKPAINPRIRHFRFWSDAVPDVDMSLGRGDRINHQLILFHISPCDG